MKDLVKYTRVSRGPEVGSDHFRVVVSEIRLPPKWKKFKSRYCIKLKNNLCYLNRYINLIH